MQNTYKAILVKATNCFECADGHAIKPPMKVVRLHGKGKHTSEGIVTAVNAHNTLETLIQVIKAYLKEFDTAISEYTVTAITEQSAGKIAKAIKEDNHEDLKLTLKVTPTSGEEHEINVELIATEVNC